MRVLVTGGAGFIGSHLVDRLVETGDDVWVFDNLSSGREANVNPRARLLRGDLRTTAIADALQVAHPEVVFHMAAQIDVRTSVADPVGDAETNILGTIRLLDACAAQGVQKIVYSSSAAVYGEPRCVPIDEEHPIAPLSPYGLSKYVVERYLPIYRDLHGVNFSVLRYANVFGPRQAAHGDGAVVATFAQSVADGERCTIHGTGLQTRDLVYVRDVAEANRAAVSPSANSAVVNISTGRETTMVDLLDQIEEAAGRSAGRLRGPARSGDIFRSCLSNRLAGSLLGWEPRTALSEGLAATLDWACEAPSAAIMVGPRP